MAIAGNSGFKLIRKGELNQFLKRLLSYNIDIQREKISFNTFLQQQIQTLITYKDFTTPSLTDHILIANYTASFRNIAGIITHSSFAIQTPEQLVTGDIAVTAVMNPRPESKDGEFKEVGAWEPKNFLITHLNFLLQIYVLVNQGAIVELPDDPIIISDVLEKEIWVTANALQIYCRYSQLLHEEKALDSWVTEFLKALQESCDEMEEWDELSFPCGTKKHGISIGCILINGSMIFRLDNAGLGRDKAPGLIDEDMVTPLLLTAIPVNKVSENEPLHQYFKRVCLASNKLSPEEKREHKGNLAEESDRDIFDDIYNSGSDALPLPEVDFNLTTICEPVNKQWQNNCVVYSFLMGMRSRTKFSGVSNPNSIFNWLIDKTIWVAHTDQQLGLENPTRYLRECRRKARANKLSRADTLKHQLESKDQSFSPRSLQAVGPTKVEIKKVLQAYYREKSAALTRLFTDDLLPITEYYVPQRLLKPLDEKQFSSNPLNPMVSLSRFVNLKDIFKRNKKTVHVILFSKAGGGNKAFCQNLVYNWSIATQSSETVWLEQFDSVISLDFSSFTADNFPEKEDKKPYKLVEVLRAHLPELAAISIEETEQYLQTSKILWVIYNFSENNSNIPSYLHSAVNYFVKKVPYRILMTHSDGFSYHFKNDTRLEIAGFSKSEIKRYIELFYKPAPTPSDEKSVAGTQVVLAPAVKANALLSYIERTPQITELLSNPLLLEVFCTIGPSLLEGTQTFTELYQQLLIRLLQHFYDQEILSQDIDFMSPRREEKYPDRHHSLFNHFQAELRILDHFAIRGLAENSQELPESEYKDLMDEQKLNHNLITRFIQIERVINRDEKSVFRFHFAHSSIQSFFAARFLVNGLNWDDEFYVNFLINNKYENRLESLFRLVAGLVASQKDRELTRKFWRCLQSPPLDLAGPYHRHLLILCLNETTREQDLIETQNEFCEQLVNRFKEIWTDVIKKITMAEHWPSFGSGSIIFSALNWALYKLVFATNLIKIAMVLAKNVELISNPFIANEIASIIKKSIQHPDKYLRKLTLDLLYFLVIISPTEQILELFFDALYRDRINKILSREAIELIYDVIFSIDETNIQNIDQLKSYVTEHGDSFFVQVKMLNIFLDNLAIRNEKIVTTLDNVPSDKALELFNSHLAILREPYNRTALFLGETGNWLISALARQAIFNAIIDPYFIFKLAKIPLAIFLLITKHAPSDLDRELIAEPLIVPFSLLYLCVTPNAVADAFNELTFKLRKKSLVIKRLRQFGPNIMTLKIFEALVDTLLNDRFVKVREAALETINKMVIVPVNFLPKSSYFFLKVKIINKILENLASRDASQRSNALDAIMGLGKSIITTELLRAIITILQKDKSPLMREKAAQIILNLKININAKILAALLQDQDGFWFGRRNHELVLNGCSLALSFIAHKLLGILMSSDSVINDRLLQPLAFAFVTLNIANLISVSYRFRNNEIVKLNIQILEGLDLDLISRPEIINLLDNKLNQVSNPAIKICIVKLLAKSLRGQYNEKIYSALFELLRAEKNQDVRTAILGAIASDICSKETAEIINDLQNLHKKLPFPLSLVDYNNLRSAILVNVRKKIGAELKDEILDILLELYQRVREPKAKTEFVNTLAALAASQNSSALVKKILPILFNNLTNICVLECLEQVIHFCIDDRFFISLLVDNLKIKDDKIKERTLKVLGALACAKPNPEIESILIRHIFLKAESDIRKIALQEIGKIATRNVNISLLAALLNALDKSDLVKETLIILANLKSPLAIPAFINKLFKIALESPYLESEIVNVLSNMGEILALPEVLRNLSSFEHVEGKLFYHKICLQMLQNCLRNDAFDHAEGLAEAVLDEKNTVTLVEDKLIVRGKASTLKVNVDARTRPKVITFLTKLEEKSEASESCRNSYRECIKQLNEASKESKHEATDSLGLEEKSDQKSVEAPTLDWDLNNKIVTEAERLQNYLETEQRKINQEEMKREESSNSYSSYITLPFRVLWLAGSFCWTAGVTHCRRRPHQQDQLEDLAADEDDLLEPNESKTERHAHRY